MGDSDRERFDRSLKEYERTLFVSVVLSVILLLLLQLGVSRWVLYAWVGVMAIALVVRVVRALRSVYGRRARP